MSYLYKTIRLQSFRFMTLGFICLVIFGAVAIYVSPAIIARFMKASTADFSSLNIEEQYSLALTSRNTFRPYQVSFQHLEAVPVISPKTTDNQTTQYFIGQVPQSTKNADNTHQPILIRAEIAEKLQSNEAFIAYIQPFDFMLASDKEEDEIKAIMTQFNDNNIPLNPHWILTTEAKSDAFGFAIFISALSLIPLLLLLHAGKLFLMPDRQRELRYQRKFYFEDITALSQDFDFEIQHKMVTRLKNADLFQDFIVAKEAFRFYLIPLESLVMLYPTRKFIFHSLLWFIPKSGIAVYEEERAYFVRLPAKTVQNIMSHLQDFYPYIERQKSKNHLRHAKNPEAVWQDYLIRKSQYQIAQKEAFHHA